jgi:HEPN domain-containing protein
MTPQREEGLRLLRLARRDETAFTALLKMPEVDFSVACFHAQQAVEKAIKAVMCLENLAFRRTHDLEELVGDVQDSGLVFPVGADRLRRLTPYAVEFRYNDETMDMISRAEAIEVVEATLRWASGILDGGAP